MREIRFYKEFGEYGYLATYSNHGFYKDGVFWKTSEHYYQAQKFETPKSASIIGRSRNFKIRSDWDKIKQKVMFDAVYYKFKQNKDILQKLLDTGEAEIVEATVKENYWGCGLNNDGQNNYGKILVKVREKLRQEER